jgi:hypothetical protein
MHEVYLINKGKTLSKGTREQKKRLKSKQNTKSESVECIMGSLKKRNQENLGPKPITSSMKQVVQGDGRKT